jgi:hypothetical protein
MPKESALKKQSSPAPWQGGIDWNEFLVRRGLPGGVELVITSADIEERLLELVASWICLRTGEGRLAYPKLCIITSDASRDASEMIVSVVRTFERLFGLPLPSELREAMTNGLRIIAAPVGGSISLHTLVENSAVDALVYLQVLGDSCAVHENPRASIIISPLVSLLGTLSAVMENSTGVLIVDAGNREILSDIDTKQLNSIGNLGYTTSGSISLEVVPQDKLEDLWMHAWTNGEAENALELSRALGDRFCWPTPDRMIVFHAISEYCKSNGGVDASRQAAFPLPVPELASTLSTVLKGESVDLGALASTIENAPSEWRSLILLCVANEASRRSWHIDVLTTTTTSGLSPELAAIAVDLLLTSIEAVLLSRSEHEVLEELVVAVGEVLGYIAENPNSAQPRMRLGDALAPDRSDMVGISVLSYILKMSAKIDGHVDESNEIEVSAATDDELMLFVERALQGHSNKAITIGELSIPDEIIIPSADALMERLIHLISYSQKHDYDDLDTNTHELLSAVGVALAKHTTKSNLDLEILRFLGQRLSIAGKHQRSRDVAESLLIASTESPRRMRLGWTGYADIYNRGKNQIQAAIGMCCAFAIDAQRTSDEAIIELSTTARILRDSRLLQQAEAVCETLSRRISSSNISSKEANRADFLHLSIRMQRTLEEDVGDHDEIAVLIEDVSRHLERARSLSDDALPAAIMLGQLVNIASEKAVKLTVEVHSAVKRARSSLDGRQALLFDITCGSADSACSLLAYVKQFEQARFSSDAGYDLKTAALAARRVLASRPARTNKELVVFASELLNDLGIPPPRSMSAIPTRLPTTLDGPASDARAISKLGVDIVTLASNSANHVVVTRFHQGKLVVAQELSSDIFSLQYLNRWSKKFPYRFADIPPEDGERESRAPSVRSRSTIPIDEDARFIESMEPMRLGFDLSQPTIFVANPLLQSIPPNLFLGNENFAGRSVAVGSSPSLAWLHDAVTSTQTEFGQAAAWISDSGDLLDWRATLNVLAARVCDHLAAHSIPLSRSTTPPPSLRGTELAIIGAHGGLAGENRFLRVIADDAKNRIAPNELIKALYGSRVVVLFVCSGGRVDQHPFAQSTLGLPRQLVASGVEAVIASPWPLDVRVPDHWLRSFLDAWDAGETLMEANFKANAQVAARTGSPEFALAMTVYGNPLARRNVKR